ncbi:unnamed protein product [Calypogeia fissa]
MGSSQSADSRWKWHEPGEESLGMASLFQGLQPEHAEPTASYGMLKPAQVIVAIDFGTTFSGFSFAHTQFAETDSENFLDAVDTFDRWPYQDRAGAKPYFKTLTGLLYMQKSASESSTYELRSWGWEAYVQYGELLKKSGNSHQLDGKQFHFITRFKLALAGANSYGESYSLPPGFKAESVIADYLHQLSVVVEVELRSKYGDHISRKDIQWCLTVPAIWEDLAKQQMKRCAERAGLVFGPSNTYGEASPHPIIIVLEPEAASVYCLHHLKKIHNNYLPPKRKILVVDAGGGTVDLVLHETVNSSANGTNQVKEICSGSSGALCGSTFVDAAFYKLLSQKMSCYEQYISENPSGRSRIRKEWEGHKICFDGDVGRTIWLPAGLSRYWEHYCETNCLIPPADGYEVIEITLEEMKEVFDCAVNPILELIKQQLNQVSSEEVDALVVVGGFSGSKYLMDRIHREFGRRVTQIINPPHAGKAVVSGAVAYGCLGKEIVTSRMSRRTYGVGKIDESGKWPHLMFDAFVRKGDEVQAKQCIKKLYSHQGWIPGMVHYVCFDVLSTKDRNPQDVTDPGVKREYTFTFEYPALNYKPWIEVSMFFGRTSIEVSAVGLNFHSERKMVPSITFEAERAFVR